MPRTVEILARGYSITHYHPTGCDVFTVNNMQFVYTKKYSQLPTRAYWMDSWRILKKAAPGYWNLLRELQHPIVNNEKHRLHKWIQEYPLAHNLNWLHDRVPFAKLDYINNTCVYALIDAICMGYEEIHLHGMDFASSAIEKPRGHSERSSIEYWCGIAASFGIEIRVPIMSFLMDRNQHINQTFETFPFYGYTVQPNVREILGD